MSRATPPLTQSFPFSHQSLPEPWAPYTHLHPLPPLAPFPKHPARYITTNIRSIRSFPPSSTSPSTSSTLRKHPLRLSRPPQLHKRCAEMRHRPHRIRMRFPRSTFRTKSARRNNPSASLGAPCSARVAASLVIAFNVPGYSALEEIPQWSRRWRKRGTASEGFPYRWIESARLDLLSSFCRCCSP